MLKRPMLVCGGQIFTLRSIQNKYGRDNQEAGEFRGHKAPNLGFGEFQKISLR